MDYEILVTLKNKDWRYDDRLPEPDFWSDEGDKDILGYRIMTNQLDEYISTLWNRLVISKLEITRLEV